MFITDVAYPVLTSMAFYSAGAKSPEQPSEPSEVSLAQALKQTLPALKQSVPHG